MRASLLLISVATLALAACGKPAEDAAPAATDTAAEATAPAATTPSAEAVKPTAALGEQVFKRCATCHTITKDGPNGVGPNIHGIVGRAVATHEGFAYSPAMKAKGGKWDPAALDAYLAAPMKVVPGTKMAFAGVSDATERAALLIYLAEQR